MLHPVASSLPLRRPYGGDNRDDELWTAANGGVSNPGIVDFSEDDLHERQPSCYEEVVQSLRYAPGLKTPLLLTLPTIALMLISGHGAVPQRGVAACAMFAAALLALLPSHTLVIEYLEDIVVRHDDERLGVLVNVLCEHSSALLFSLCALAREPMAICWIKGMTLGCVLWNMLAVLGASIIAAPSVDAAEVSLGLSAWSAFSAGALVYSTAVIMFPTLYYITIVAPDAERGLSATTKAATVTAAAAREEPQQLFQNMLLLSRCLSLAVLTLYAISMWRILKANGNYYASSDNPNAPSSISYVLHYQRRAQAMASAADDVVGGGSRYSQRFAIAAALSFAALEAALCYLLVCTLPAVATTTAAPLPFLLVILLPAVFEAGGFGAAILMSRGGRLDISTSIAFSATVHLYVLLLPLLVLLAWGLFQAPLDLAYHPFLVCCCFVSALVVAQVVVAHRARWLEGAMLLALYGLILMICLLGRWHLCSWNLVLARV